jgi:signal transduction histidine kinase
MLHEFVTKHRGELIERCKNKVDLRQSQPATAEDVEYGVPLFLDQLVDTLRQQHLTSPEIGEAATKHGNAMLRRGFTVDEVVHNYGDVCQSVTELAIQLDAPITTDEFRTLNKCLDDAIGDACTEHTRQHDQLVSDEQTERLGLLAHELRNLITSASLAFAALSSGTVGVGGSTSAVLERSLRGLRRLVDHSLTEVRLEAGIQNRERVQLADFVQEVRVSAIMDMKGRGIQFRVLPIADGLAVEADRQTLAAVLANLLQNAFKFSKPGSTVTLKTHVIADRVLVEVADGCGGLPPGKAEELFRPFEQRGKDRTGLGLGLAISLRGVEANGGTLRVRDVPGTGCVFTVDLPKQQVGAS